MNMTNSNAGDSDDFKDALQEIHEKEAEVLAQAMSAKYSIPYVDLSHYPINLDALKVVPQETAEQSYIGAFNLVNKKLYVAILSPENETTQKALQGLETKGFEPVVHLTSEKSLKHVWTRYEELSKSTATASGSITISDDEVAQIAERIHHLKDATTELTSQEAAQHAPRKISNIIQAMLASAIALDISDIHMEPEEQQVNIRFRLDGVLTDVSSVSNKTYEHVLARIKILSGMKLNVGGAQDGRFSIKVQDAEIEIRSSIVPSSYGESIVMRILNPKSIQVKLEQLGIHPRLLEIIKKEIAKPNGMLLNTGPTGSGKTTSLYAILRYIHTPDIKILTIENPVEYHLSGIVQTQTDEKKNYTFAAGLRAALRQDPDIIMVGEIRDQETATTAINAALTGHFVLSTLHTNNAAGTFPRLIDMGVNPKIISSALSISMAQRLVRKLCTACREEINLEGADRELIAKVTASIKDKSYLEGIQMEKVYKPKGCDKCNNTGFKGRLGVYEAIVSDEKIEAVLQNNPSEREIMKAAEDQGILTLAQDGILKVLSGTTSLEELQRVVEVE